MPIKRDIYISVDIEADGPHPGDFSMLSIGAAAFLLPSRVPVPEGEFHEGLRKSFARRVLDSDTQVLLKVPLRLLYPNVNYPVKEGEDFLLVEPKDVHTEHCCKRCGCKYSSSDCTVVRGKLAQSYKHFHTSVCYEMHPDYMRREREYRGEGDGGMPEEPDREDFPVYLASLLGISEDTSKEDLLRATAERLGLTPPLS